MKISCEAETHTLITLQQNDLLCTSGFVEAFAAPPWFQTLKLRSNMNHRASTNSVNCAVVRRSTRHGGSRRQHAEEVVGPRASAKAYRSQAACRSSTAGMRMRSLSCSARSSSSSLCTNASLPSGVPETRRPCWSGRRDQSGRCRDADPASLAEGRSRAGSHSFCRDWPRLQVVQSPVMLGCNIDWLTPHTQLKSCKP